MDNEELNEFYEKMAQAVVDGNEDECIRLANLGIEEQIDAYDIIIKGCAHGMTIVSDLYEKREMFVPEILLSARAMSGAVDILKPYIKTDDIKETGCVCIGVVLGDIHDIGKNLVKLLLETAGLRVIDLGRDVPTEDFIETVEKEKVDIVALSALMTTSMMEMKETVKELNEKYPNVKTMVGGAPVSKDFADKIGADSYADNASEAIRVVQGLLG